MKSNKPFYKKTLFIVAASAVVLICGGWGFSRYNRMAKFRSQQEGRAVKVVRRDVKRDLLLTGKVLPASSIAVYSPVSGQLRQILVSEGQRVKENEILFAVQQDTSGQKELEARQSEVQRTRLELQAAEENLERRKIVKDLFSQTENEKAENDYQRAKLAFDAARQQLTLLEDTLGLAATKNGRKQVTANSSKSARLSMIYMKAPKQGVVTFLNKAVGESVMATTESAESTGREVLIISDTDKMMVRSRILESDLAVVKVGQAVQIKLDAFPNKPYQGVVSRISQQGVEDKAGGYTYFVTDMLIKNPDLDVRAQMNASIELLVAEHKNVLALPANAVATLAGHSVVELPRNSPSEPPHYKSIRTGLTTDLWIEILNDDMNEGTEVLEIDFAKLDLARLADGTLSETTRKHEPSSTSKE